MTASARRPRSPGRLRGEEFALYELIWKRTVASQMADARGSTATVKLAVDTALEGAQSVEFSASGTVITFKGFLAAYEEGRDDEAAARADAAAEERRLPKLSRRASPLEVVRAEADGHETSPPARYTEATLVKAMEEQRHRPPVDVRRRRSARSRTAATSSPSGTALVPTWLAFAVTRLLEEHFGEPRRLRLHRLDGGGPRPHRRRRRAARRLAEALLLRRGEADARPTGAAQTSSRTSARSTPGRSRRSRIGDGMVVRVGSLRPVRRGDRARRVDLGDGRGRRRRRVRSRRAARRSTTTSPPTR